MVACVECSKQFEPKAHNQVYCGKRCMYVASLERGRQRRLESRTTKNPVIPIGVQEEERGWRLLWKTCLGTEQSALYVTAKSQAQALAALEAFAERQKSVAKTKLDYSREHSLFESDA